MSMQRPNQVQLVRSNRRVSGLGIMIKYACVDTFPDVKGFVIGTKENVDLVTETAALKHAPNQFLVGSWLPFIIVE